MHNRKYINTEVEGTPFTSVVYENDKPVLDVELNEMQALQENRFNKLMEFFALSATGGVVAQYPVKSVAFNTISIPSIVVVHSNIISISHDAINMVLQGYGAQSPFSLYIVYRIIEKDYNDIIFNNGYVGTYSINPNITSNIDNLVPEQINNTMKDESVGTDTTKRLVFEWAFVLCSDTDIDNIVNKFASGELFDDMGVGHIIDSGYGIAADIHALDTADTAGISVDSKIIIASLGDIDNVKQEISNILSILQNLSQLAFTANWSEINNKPTFFPPSSHNHTKSQIADFPSSMPASDVKAWAKANSKPSYNWSEINNKPTFFPPSSHNHTKSQITDFNGNDYINQAGDTMNGDLIFSKTHSAKFSGYDDIKIPKIQMETSMGWLNIYAIFGGYRFEYESGSGWSRHIDIDLSQGYRIYTKLRNDKSNSLDFWNTYITLGTLEVYSPYANEVIIGPYSHIMDDYGNALDICNYDGNNNLWVSPHKDGSGTLGASDRRWKQIYASTSTISTSDYNFKKEISYIGDIVKKYDIYMDKEQLKSFILGLRACIYKLKDGESGRPHHGLIAQDVEKLLQELGIDHAAFIKSPKTKDIEIEEEEEYIGENGNKSKRITKKIIQEEIPGEYIYSLRYEEFVADIIYFCQILYGENQELREKIDKLEERIDKLEQIIRELGIDYI